jgi:hypothetical protein
MKKTDVGAEKTHVLKWRKYIWFLLFPLITLVLLQAAPWHEDNSECIAGGAQLKNKKCTCSEEVPFLLYMMIVFECFAYLYFILEDPFTSLHYRPFDSNENWKYNQFVFTKIAIFDALYIALLVSILDALLRSDKDCSFPIYFFGVFFFVFRSLIVIAINILPWINQKQSAPVTL